MTLHGRIVWGIAALAMIAGTLLGQTQTTEKLPADINPTSRARLPQVQRSALNEADQKIYDVLPGGRGGSLGGPLAFAAYNPQVAKALFDLHNAAVGGTMSTNAHVRELAILVACRETNYNLEWNGHEQAAVRAGVDAKVIDVVRQRGPLTGVNDADAAVIRFGREIFTDKKVSSATFAKMVDLVGQRGVMDVVAVMNTYAVSGFYAIAVDEQPAANRPALPPVK
jgi:4-carboxymuconolactone decarboxylase